MWAVCKPPLGPAGFSVYSRYLAFRLPVYDAMYISTYLPVRRNSLPAHYQSSHISLFVSTYGGLAYEENSSKLYELVH
jgi:hypothetical protein